MVYNIISFLLILLRSLNFLALITITIIVKISTQVGAHNVNKKNKTIETNFIRAKNADYVIEKRWYMDEYKIQEQIYSLNFSLIFLGTRSAATVVVQRTIFAFIIVIIIMFWVYKKKTYFHSCSHRGKSDVITKNIHLLTLSTPPSSRRIWKERNVWRGHCWEHFCQY